MKSKYSYWIPAFAGMTYYCIVTDMLYLNISLIMSTYTKILYE
jgi:hypothetical protein